MKINIDFIYPIGSIYATTSNVSPDVLFGGSWERYAAGRCLVGYQSNDTDFNTVGHTGGEKTHRLTSAEMPSHQHNMHYGAGSVWGSAVTPAGFADTYYDYSGHMGQMGGDQAHNNLQPYIVVYYWRRTA